MEGIINCYKPSGITSFDVIRKLKKIFLVKKIGHGGTLDPDAEGVLPIFIGKATKLIEYQKDLTKIYRAEMLLGKRTDTQDREGRVIEEKEIPLIKHENLRALLDEFTGNIEQIPPMYSAIKYKGRKLYELARKGIEVYREPRKVNIYKIELIDYVSTDGLVFFEVECSPGTYIRTLCEDIGIKIGCGGCLNSLIRCKSGSFYIDNSNTIDEIIFYKEKGLYEKFLLPIDTAVKHIYSVIVKPEFEHFISKGMGIYSEHLISNYILPKNQVCIYNNRKFLLAVGQVCPLEDKRFYLKLMKVFV